MRTGFLQKITAYATVLMAVMVVCRIDAAPNASPTILIINSYNSEYAWTRYQETGFTDEIRKYRPKADFFTEYLDAKRMVLSPYRNEFARLLKEKYQKKTISVIYTTDDVATEFVHDFADEIGFGKIPLVASGINNLKNISTERYPTTIGVQEVQNVKSIVELALEQNPHAKRLVIVSDYTAVGKDIAEDITTQVKAVSGIPIERIPPMTFRETSDYLSHFTPDTLFIIGTYSVDKEGRYTPAYDSATENARAAKGPMYAIHDTHVASPEIVGGYVNSGADQGRIAAQAALQVIEGKPVGEIQVQEPRFTWVFNYGALTRYGISTHGLPFGSVIVGKPDSIIEKHPVITAIVVIGITAQTFLIVFLLMNIAKRNAATKALTRSEAKLRMLLEYSPLAVFISDKEGNIAILNNRFRSLFGYNLSEAKTLDDMKRLLTPDPEYRAKVNEQMRSNYDFAKQNGINPPPVEYVARAKNGTKVDVEMYYEETGDMVFRILHDVTERNTIMRELRQASTTAMAANEAKSRFIANVSHEIRAPMNGILGMAQMLNETGMSRQQMECVESISHSCNILLTVINDILDLSRIEAGKLTLNPQPVAFRPFLDSLVGIAAPELEGKGLEFKRDFRDSLPDIILCDPDRLKQALMNLLSNAGKFTDKGHVELLVACSENNDRRCRLHFAVSDTGIGIAPEMQQAVFEPFVQADTSRTRKAGGTGMGLSIARKLVQLMGGEMTLESEPGHGSTFSFDIVCDVLSQEESASDADLVAPDFARNYPLKILVAEDNPASQRDIRRMLGKMGYDYQMVSNGIEAVDIALHHEFDVILMDLHMPSLDGISATIRIRKTKPSGEQPRILGMTGHTLGDDAQRCVEAGMNGCLGKPMRANDLQDALIRVFREIHPSDGTV